MAAPTFIDRVRELSALEGFWQAPGAQLVVLYGRRRVGKTELLRRFCLGKRHVHFQAAVASPIDNLRHFLGQAAEGTGDAVPALAAFADWESSLRYLAQRSGQERLVVVLDEFPYLCEGDPALPSLLQRFWDQHGSRSSLMLVLCGSSVSFMEQEVLAHRSPLFGRRTGQIELLPLTYRDAAGFLPRYPPEQLVPAYGILGGMPMYQRQFDSSASVARNVQRRILQPEALLYAEPELLLRMELRDPGVYQSVLQAVADGLTKHNEIAGRIGKPATSASPYLATLERLRLLERVAPITSPQGKRSSGRYFIRDPFLRFWYRFVQPNRSLLELGEAQRVWNQHIGPRLDEYLGAAFEAICREYVGRYGEETLGVLPAGEVGRFWSRDAEIDLLCRNADGTSTCGECKWTRRLVGDGDLDRLREKSTALPSDWQEGLRYVLFSRAGFTDALRHRATEERVTLVDLEDLYGAR